MSGDVRGTAAEALRALRVEASSLVESLPGPLRRIAVRAGDHTVEIEWPNGDTPQVPTVAAHSLRPVSQSGPTTSAEAEGAKAEESHIVLAPLVGTFYSAPQPGAEPFVVVGDTVQPGQPLAIVEAMKLMNQISAEIAGRVVEVLVASGDAVEFEQPLMRIALDTEDVG